jgi:hypothetical protein
MGSVAHGGLLLVAAHWQDLNAGIAKPKVSNASNAVQTFPLPYWCRA